MHNYDLNYIKWQKQNVNTFANLSKQKNYYFKKVIEKIKINKDKPPKKILEIGYGKGEFLIFAFDVLGHLEKIKLNELF